MEVSASGETRLLQTHLAKVWMNLSQQWTTKLDDEIFSSVSAQHMDTSGWQVSDLENKELQSENPGLNMDTFFRFGRRSPFFLHFSTILRSVQRLKTWFWLTTRKTRRNIHIQHLQCRTIWLNLPCCWNVASLDTEWLLIVFKIFVQIGFTV